MYYVVPENRDEKKRISGLFQGSYMDVPVAVTEEPVSVDGFVVKLATKEPEKFFHDLKKIIFKSHPFTWRKKNGRVELAVLPQDHGWWIGRKGHRIQALEAHLETKIQVIPGKLVANKDHVGVGRKITGVPMLGIAELVCSAFDLAIRNAGYGKECTHGYCAPWEISAVS